MSETQGPHGRMRSAARLAAVQAIYEMEVAGATADMVVAAFLTNRWDQGPEGPELAKPDPVHLAQVIRGVAARREAIDVSIDMALSDKFNVTRLEALLLAILRAGAYELSSCPEVPAKVVINEYLDVAHAFFTGKEPGLVNAVLDRMAVATRPGEAAGGGPPAEREEALDGEGWRGGREGGDGDGGR